MQWRCQNFLGKRVQRAHGYGNVRMDLLYNTEDLTSGVVLKIAPFLKATKCTCEGVTNLS